LRSGRCVIMDPNLQRTNHQWLLWWNSLVGRI
jgi:hypothetical protein